MMRTSVFVNVLLQRRLHVHLNLVLGYCCAAAEPPASASDVHADLLLDVMQHNLTLQPWQRDSLRVNARCVVGFGSCWGKLPALRCCCKKGGTRI
jgi:hypothetical protein